MQKGPFPILSSFLVLLLTVFAIVVFIFYGYSILFYAVLAPTLALAIFNTWLVSRHDAGRHAHSSRKKLKR